MMLQQLPIDAFVHYFGENLESSHQEYYWPVGQSGKSQAELLIPEFKWHTPSGGSDECIALKHHLTAKWETADLPERRLLARWIVAGWGGVRTNREETLEAHLAMSLDENSNKPLKGVASYSKILSVVDCKKYAIYDARVAACLNAVQLYTEAKSPVFFRYIPSRNGEFKSYGREDNFIKIFSKETLVGTKKEIASGIRKWTEVEPDHTYSTYLHLLNTMKKYFPGKELYHFEMALFSAAPFLCAELAKKHYARL
ncbi:hypothetical protein [Fibrella arboris]|uniref:hypothetical protein n=1 Tax=Fibrella arboris TaxID=3242486 RepID=UPI0035200E32